MASSLGELHPGATVSKLINQTSGWWNVQLIDRCFHPLDVTRIKSLPLCSTPQPDVLTWSLEKSGKYFVKPGFRLMCDGLDSAANLNQANSEERVFWKKLLENSGSRKNKLLSLAGLYELPSNKR